MLDGDLLAERADLDELRALVGSEANGALPEQERALADRAHLHMRNLGHVHTATIARACADARGRAKLLTCVFYM